MMSFTPSKNVSTSKWIIDLLPKIHAGSISVEAADVRHELDWKLWEKFTLPAGKTYIPGVIAHQTSTIEPPNGAIRFATSFASITSSLFPRWSGTAGRNM
jgi:5-methyltetrahydropteroyltriglutamate--homocysteine methyltransferase